MDSKITGMTSQTDGLCIAAYKEVGNLISRERYLTRFKKITGTGLQHLATTPASFVFTDLASSTLTWKGYCRTPFGSSSGTPQLSPPQNLVIFFWWLASVNFPPKQSKWGNKHLRTLSSWSNDKHKVSVPLLNQTQEHFSCLIRSNEQFPGT